VENENNPLQPSQTLHCGAKTRSGTPCQSVPVRGKKRCRMHGGVSPGAPRGNQNALKTGAFTREVLMLRLEARATLKSLKELVKQYESSQEYTD
jgi:glucans biosynthesis protein